MIVRKRINKAVFSFSAETACLNPFCNLKKYNREQCAVLAVIKRSLDYSIFNGLVRFIIIHSNH